MKKKILITILTIVVVAGMSVGLFYLNKYNREKAVINVVNDYDTGNLDGAIDKSLQNLEKDKNNVNALLLLAATYAQKGSVTFKEEGGAVLAIETADKVLAIDPKNSEAYRIKGYAFEIQEKYDDAHGMYEKAIELNPRNSQAHSNNGHAYDLQGDLEKAEQLYNQALKIDPSNDHALLNLARLYVRQNKFELARKTVDSLISASTSNRMKAEGYQVLSYISFNEEEIDQALDEIQRSVSLDETMPQAWVMKAKVELSTALDMETDAEIKQLIESVRADAKKAIAINPNQASAYLLLSEVEIITGDKKAGDEWKKKALEAIDQDITLGKKEKESMRSYINSKITIKKN